MNEIEYCGGGNPEILFLNVIWNALYQFLAEELFTLRIPEGLDHSSVKQGSIFLSGR